MGLSGLPTDLVRLEKRLGVVAQRLANFEHRPELLTHRAWCHAAFVHGLGDLVNVPADSGKLGDTTLERQELILGERRTPAQVRTDEDGDVRRRSHSPCLGASVQQQPVLASQAHEDGLAAAIRTKRLSPRPAYLLGAAGLTFGAARSIARTNLPKN
jgi:hypothetical protein